MDARKLLACAACMAATASPAFAQSAVSIETAAGLGLVDGVYGAEWSLAPLNYCGTIIDGGKSSDADLCMNWASLWDADYLYVLAMIQDDHLVSDPHDPAWENDSIELYFDGDNSDNTSYDGDNDYQYVWEYDATGHPPIYGVNSRPDATGVVTAGSLTADGWLMEAAIPWSLLFNHHDNGVTAPMSGLEIGIDVQANDDDDGGHREAAISWATMGNFSWTDPSMFGTLELTPVPEPSTYALALGLALAIIAIARQRIATGSHA